MGETPGKPMFIYVSGPYSPLAEETDPVRRAQIIDNNVRRADEVARAIAAKGHFPFVPHTMMRGWEDTYGISRERALEICHRWVEKCDALYFIAPSAGAESERKVAVSLDMPIYRELDDVPEADPRASARQLSPEALEAYLAEYQECADCYRHTYTTIWEAGAVFSVVSAAMFTFGGSSEWVQMLAPIPLIFWYLGIYVPMNRYGELRNDRLVEIERLLNEAVPELRMRHFIQFDTSRKEVGFAERIRRGKWRVRDVVSIFGVCLILVELYLVWVHVLAGRGP